VRPSTMPLRPTSAMADNRNQAQSFEGWENRRHYARRPSTAMANRPTWSGHNVRRRPSTSFSPLILGKGDKDDVPAGHEGPASQGVKPPGSAVGYRCHTFCEDRPDANYSEVVADIEGQDAVKLNNPSYPRTTISIGYQGYIPHRQDSFGTTCGVRIGTTSPHREHNLRDTAAAAAGSETNFRGTTTAASFEEDRLATSLQPFQVSPKRVASAPRERRPTVDYIERHRRDTRNGNHPTSKMYGRATVGSANQLFRVSAPNGRLGWNTPNRPESPSRKAEAQKMLTFEKSDLRRKWTAKQLEELLRDKITQKTKGSNGQALQAMRLFLRDGTEISPEAWKKNLPLLVGVELTDEEAMALFNKYDTDGGGSIDVQEFIENVLPADFAKRRELALESDSGVPTGYEGPRVSVPPGFCGHLPGGARRYGVAYGESALRAWTTKEPKTPGVYREVSVSKQISEAGAFPGHNFKIK